MTESLRPDAATPVQLLAIDTATDRLALAVLHGQRQWTAEEEGGARASSRALPLAFELLAAAGVRARELNAVAFGQGPGAFTGLRTACAIAQGLALGAGCPVIAIDSLLLVAEDARRRGVDVAPVIWVVMDARMDEVYAAAYAFDGALWQTLRAPALWSLPALSAEWQATPPACVAGSALAAFGDRLPTGSARRVVDAEDRAAALAALARAALARGEGVDAALAMPVYVRDKVALTTAERARARADAPAS
jgi:tRNA threonylcarbamoyladenosine biosynthesis protein TsaB